MSAPRTFSDNFDLHNENFSVGVAPRASLVVCRVSHGGPQPEWVNKALQWIVDHNNLVLKASEVRNTADEELRAKHVEGCKLNHIDKKIKFQL